MGLMGIRSPSSRTLRFSLISTRRMLTETLKRGWSFVKARYAPRGARICFAQYGEDRVMFEILKKHLNGPLSYIDIGAHHPYFGNNTYLFYREGGRGVVIEPNRSLLQTFKRIRPRDTALDVGVGPVDGSSDYFAFSQSTRSTFSAQQAEEHQRRTGQHPTREQRTIRSLDSIVDEFFQDRPLALLSIDAEGLDDAILSAYSFRVRPTMICVETTDQHGQLASILRERGYTMVALVMQNAIYLDTTTA
jgi:FkbM family methyltransferase